MFSDFVIQWSSFNEGTVTDRVVDFATTFRLLIEAALHGAAELGDAAFVTPPSVRDGNYTVSSARGLVLLRTLVEVQKAGLAMLRWAELGEQVLDRFNKTTPKHSIEALQVQAIIDEQSLRRRKLAEALILNLCFSATNSDSYYFHYLLIEDLSSCLYDLREQKNFFGRESKVLGATAIDLLAKIGTVENSGKVNYQDAWYMVNPRAISNESPAKLKASLATSIGTRFRTALRYATEQERFALGYSYRIAVSEPSADIHFSVLNGEVNASTIEQFKFGCIMCGFTAAATLARAQSNAGVAPKGLASDFVRKTASRTMPKTTPFTGGVVKGDFVVVTLPSGPFLGQSLEVATNGFNYEVHRIRFLDETPFPGLQEDWILANRISIYHKRDDLLADVKAQILANEAPDAPHLAALLAEDNLEEAMRVSITATWTLGMRKLWKRAFDERGKPTSET